ncbi:hypothetical protein EZV62_017958 [Acer yangbiense]|uniref:DUF7912 domain-containing protein n=1 Tax=Acer yangbiense TaxID=1000413 RepID=A0A5C7HIR5_9ROSI|nr:hypothetical protein EZV62_017958 [Acer yangbiense]
MMKKRMIVEKLLRLRRAGDRSSLIFNLPIIVDPPIQYSSLTIQNQNQNLSCSSSLKPTCLFASLTHRFLGSRTSTQNKDDHQDSLQCNSDDEEITDGWEEEDEVDPEFGDGGDGGGVVLQGCSWGERALSIAHQVLLLRADSDDIKLFAFKTTPRGYVYVRLDKLSHNYVLFRSKVSSPGAERILKVPDDLSRFKDMPMRVCYVDEESDCINNRVFLLESIEMDSDKCVWKLADVKENRDVQSKGRPMNRKQKDWRLNLPFEMHRMVTLYLDC